MDYQVVVVGGGPVGVMVASELALAGVKVCVLEKRKKITPYSRALTLHPRSLELLDMRGLKEKLESRGRPIPTGHFASLDTRLDFSVFDSTSNYTLFIPQNETEEVLEEWAKSLDVDIRREVEVVSVRQHTEVVEVTGVGPQGEFTLQAAYVVGADGAGSTVRKQTGIPFTGTGDTLTAMLGDVMLTELEKPTVLSRYSEQGGTMIVPMNSGLHRVIVVDPERTSVPKSEPVTLEELSAGLKKILGADFGISSPYWLSRFGNATRQAERYREGRIFLAGDAAHIHLPAGGQGLNVGLQEAVNLGWKLAAALKGWAPEGLLDSYHQERMPVNTALLRNTRAQAVLMASDFSQSMGDLRSLLSELLQIPETNRLLADQISAFNIRYESDPLAPAHSLNGSRLRDLKLRTEEGALHQAYEFFRSGSFVLLHFAGDQTIQEADWSRYPHIKPVFASLAENAADWADVHTALVRPDGYVAWALSRSESEPMEAVRQGVARWCGEAGFF
ncbi:monooxygenase [Paenibacillus jiagnxiensis]|uniref:monooxygenase n=1 Tax=Paenibacillus jiagnxiensis TaxID=3228926 RepID=UPI0033B93695